MRKSTTIAALILAAVMLSNVKTTHAEIDTSFAGFPTINVFSPGNPSYTGELPSDYIQGALRPKWTRAMGDIGGWPSFFEFNNDIYLEFHEVDGHRGANGQPGATGNIKRYRSSDQGNTWDLLGGNLTGHTRLLGEYVVKGNTLYRYEWVPTAGQSYVSTSTDGVNFTSMQPVYQPGFSMYGAMYDAASDKFYAPPHYLPPLGGNENDRQARLITSDDGLNWTDVATIHGPGGAESETALYLRDDGAMFGYVRQKWGSNRAYLASSGTAPYDSWMSAGTNTVLEGHQFFEVDGQLFLGSRAWLDPSITISEDTYWGTLSLGNYGTAFTMIYKVDELSMMLTPWAVLDSAGDNSYPRVVVTDDEVLITYYSQHQDRFDKVYMAAFDKNTFLGLQHVPEPSTFFLAAVGLAAVGFTWFKRRARK